MAGQRDGWRRCAGRTAGPADADDRAGRDARGRRRGDPSNAGR